MPSSTQSTVLNAIYKSADTGGSSVDDLLPKTENMRLREDLKAQRTRYKRLASRAEGALAAIGEHPQGQSSAGKLGMKAGVEMQTLLNTSSSHIAEMMINGSTMGIINITKIMNGYPDADSQTRTLSEEFLSAERENIEAMKRYLQ